MDLYDDVFRYDLVHGRFADPETLHFFREQIKRYGQPVLDLACGTGNLLIPLAEEGVEISGIDLSENMLSACCLKATERNVLVELERGDMRSFDLDRKFRTILIAGCSFQHLETELDISNCLEAVGRHLEPDGRLIVELFNPIVSLLMQDSGKHYMIGEFEHNVLSEEMTYDPGTQVNNITWHFWDRKSDSTTRLTFSTREYFPEELDSLFDRNGFAIEKRFGDFDGSDFNENSSKQIIVAKPTLAE
jgi:ubiquinone/menaquinone biosynthesis C-methylase UbiE